MITVNGEMQEFKEQNSLQELLLQLDLSGVLCAVEVNNSLVPHNERAECKISDGDSIEIVTLVGGG